MDFDVQTMVKMASFIGAGFCIGLGAIGAALGEGYTAGMANQGISENPSKSGDIIKNMLVGQAVAESAGIFALVVAILLIFMKFPAVSMLKAAALLGAGLSMGAGAIGSGIGSGYPGGGACLGISRQPSMSGRLTTNMLIGSAVCQTPAIFALVLAMMLLFLDFGSAAVSPTWAALLGAGICMGFGAIGSGHRLRIPGRGSMPGHRKAARDFRPSDHQHADRVGRVPDAGHFFHGRCVDARFSEFWKCPCFPYLGGLAGRRPRHRNGGDWIRDGRGHGSRGQLRRDCQEPGDLRPGDHDDARGAGCRSDAVHSRAAGQFHPDL
jgi:ATP synthase F0 subunit c